MGNILALTLRHWKLGLAVSGWVLLGIMTSLYLGCRDEFSAEIERCKTEKLESLLQADRVARRAGERAAAAHLAELDKMAEKAAAAEFDLMQERLRTQEATIRLEAFIEEASRANPESCLNNPIDPDVLNRMRSGENN